jgi:hypothetical protein
MKAAEVLVFGSATVPRLWLVPRPAKIENALIARNGRGASEVVNFVANSRTSKAKSKATQGWAHTARIAADKLQFLADSLDEPRLERESRRSCEQMVREVWSVLRNVKGEDDAAAVFDRLVNEAASIAKREGGCYSNAIPTVKEAMAGAGTMVADEYVVMHFAETYPDLAGKVESVRDLIIEALEIKKRNRGGRGKTIDPSQRLETVLRTAHSRLGLTLASASAVRSRRSRRNKL